MELLPLLNPTNAATQRCKGICLTGAPPVQLGHPDPGFKLRRSEDGKPFAAEAEHLSEDDIIAYANASAGVKLGGRLQPFHIENVRRCDGKARAEMWAVFRPGKEGIDQRQVVETTDVSTAVINGAEEDAIDLDYLDTVKWSKLWKGECIRVDGLGHGPFWENFERFEPCFKEWVSSVE